MSLIVITSGRICLALAYCLCCWCGVTFAERCMAWLFAQGANSDVLVWGHCVSLAVAAGLTLGVAYSRRKLGRPGVRGLVGSLVFQAYIMLMTLLVAGSIMLPIMGTFYAPIVALQVLQQAPHLMLMGLGLGLCVYGLIRVWSCEQIDPFERRLWALSL